MRLGLITTRFSGPRLTRRSKIYKSWYLKGAHEAFERPCDIDFSSGFLISVMSHLVALQQPLRERNSELRVVRCPKITDLQYHGATFSSPDLTIFCSQNRSPTDCYFGFVSVNGKGRDWWGGYILAWNMGRHFTFEDMSGLRGRKERSSQYHSMRWSRWAYRSHHRRYKNP